MVHFRTYLRRRFYPVLKAGPAHPLYNFYCVVFVCLALAVVVLIWAWFIDPKNFVPNALVELGATFLTVGLTALGVDQVIKSRDLYHARQEWRRTRGYALTETCRSLQKIVFACLSFLPERLRNDDQPHSTWGLLVV